jgi:hypothetical protein
MSCRLALVASGLLLAGAGVQAFLPASPLAMPRQSVRLAVGGGLVMKDINVGVVGAGR